MKGKTALVSVFAVALLTSLLSGLIRPVFSQEPPAKVDPETLMDALNDTLKENRTLRKQVEEYESQVKQLKSDHTLLLGQVKVLTRERESKRSELRKEAQEVQKDLKDVQNLQEELRLEQTRLEQSKAEMERTMDAVRSENERLKEVIENSLIEGEREQYMTLVQDAEQAAAQTVEKLAESETERHVLGKELAAVSSTLGNYLFRQEKYDEAIDQYKRSLELDPDDSWTHHNLAVIYDFHKNDNEQAMDHYRKYLKLKPVSEQANNIRERLLELQLRQEIEPSYPLKKDFDEYSDKIR